MEVFRELPLKEVKALAASIRQWDYKQGTLIYHDHDPADELFIVADGVIELLDPGDNMRPFDSNGGCAVSCSAAMSVPI